jgi:hypothetical protein
LADEIGKYPGNFDLMTKKGSSNILADENVKISSARFSPPKTEILAPPLCKRLAKD